MKEITQATAVRGSITAPPSKAHTLRAIIIGALAKGTSTIKNGLIAEDQRYAIKAMQQLGATISVDEKNKLITITGVDGKPTSPKEPVFIGNSGLTVRFLASIAGLAQGTDVTIDGVERMRTGRPIQDLLDALAPLGVQAVSLAGNGCPPIKVTSNSFVGGTTELSGDKSSQYFSSILIAAPYAQKDVTITTLGDLSSKPYIDVTIASMKEFGVTAENKNYASFHVKANQHYQGKTISIEGDYSNAAYFFAAAAILGGSVKVTNLSQNSKQGDKFFIDALAKMGCKVNRGPDFVELTGAPLKGLGDVDMNNYPDIVMPLAVVAAFASGTTHITNVAHLKLKESDRLTVTVTELQKLGAQATCDDSSLTIVGTNGAGLHGATIDSNNDHRIAMSFTIAGLKIGGVTIQNEDAVNKSFPEFYEELEKILVRPPAPLPQEHQQNIFLIGYRGTGKSTLGRRIARELNFPFIDLDEVIVKNARKTVPDIFAQEGEAQFRVYETQALTQVCEQKNIVVACGGGIVTRNENIKLLKEHGLVVLLKASVETIFKRTHGDKNRPALTNKDPLSEIITVLARRHELYERAKDIEVWTDRASIPLCAGEVVEHFYKLHGRSFYHAPTQEPPQSN